MSQPTVSVQVDLAAAQRYGLRPGDVRREASALISGLTVGSLYEQQAIFDVVVWGGPQTRANVEQMKDMLVHTPSGQPVRLGDVATVEVAPTPTVITHDGVRRSLDVTAEVRGRDAADVAADATARLRQMTFEDEYRRRGARGRGGARQTPAATSCWPAIAAAVLAFLLLQAGTNSWRGAAALFVSAPLAAGGALLAGYLVGGAWSIPVLGGDRGRGGAGASASRWCWSGGRRSCTDPPGDRAGRGAARPRRGSRRRPVLIAVLVTAAALRARRGHGRRGRAGDPPAVRGRPARAGSSPRPSSCSSSCRPCSRRSAVCVRRPWSGRTPPTASPEPAATPANVTVQPRPHDNDDVTVGKGGARDEDRARSYGIASLFMAAALGAGRLPDRRPRARRRRTPSPQRRRWRPTPAGGPRS